MPQTAPMSDQAKPPVDEAAEVSRGLLREAIVDDIAQKLAINRAVYAAGYGIDPRPYGQPYTPPQPAPAGPPNSAAIEKGKRSIAGVIGLVGTVLGLPALGIAGALIAQAFNRPEPSQPPEPPKVELPADRDYQLKLLDKPPHAQPE